MAPLTERAHGPTHGAESGTIPAANTRAAVMIDPVEFGAMRQSLKQNTEAIGVLTKSLEEFRDEFHLWRERFAFGKGMVMAGIVLAVFAGVGIKEALGVLAKFL